MKVALSILRRREPHDVLISEKVEQYRRMLRCGLGLALIKVTPLPDGLMAIEDGEHRAHALLLEGEREADVVMVIR